MSWARRMYHINKILNRKDFQELNDIDKYIMINIEM